MTALVVRDDQDTWDEFQLAALRSLGVKDATNADLALFMHQCQRTGLDPFAKQIYLVHRAGKATIQTGIDGYRLVARRAADRTGHTLGYEDTAWCGSDGAWVDVWLSDEHPTAARVVVVRDGGRFPATALWKEYNAGGRSWENMGALMLAKCAEALALRKAFPQDLSGVYTSEEMAQSERQVPSSHAAALTEAVSTAQEYADSAEGLDIEALRRMWAEAKPVLEDEVTQGGRLGDYLTELMRLAVESDKRHAEATKARRQQPLPKVKATRETDGNVANLNGDPVERPADEWIDQPKGELVDEWGNPLRKPADVVEGEVVE